MINYYVNVLVIFARSLSVSWEDFDMCLVEKDEGEYCSGWEIKWHFEPLSANCRQFYYGGCKGNANRFSNEDDCLKTCVETEHVSSQGSRPRRHPAQRAVQGAVQGAAHGAAHAPGTQASLCVRVFSLSVFLVHFSCRYVAQLFVPLYVPRVMADIHNPGDLLSLIVLYNPRTPSSIVLCNL